MQNLPTAVKFKSIKAGDYDTVCAVGTDNKIYCWGKASSGQLGNGTEGSLDKINIPAPINSPV